MNAVIDRVVQYPHRYQLKNVDTGEVLGTFDLEPITGTISIVGTKIDKELFDSIASDIGARLVSNGGDAKDNIITYTMADSRSNIVSDEKLSVSFGKIAKYLNDLKAIAFSGNKADIGLGNVDNTADTDKPVSTATQTALDAKVDKAGGRLTGDLAVGNTRIFASGSNGGFNSMLIGDDAFLGDCDVGGHIGVKSRTSDFESGFVFSTSNSKNLGRITFSLSGARIMTPSNSTIVKFSADMHSEFAGYSVFAGYVQSPYYTSDNTCHINASNNHELSIDTNDGNIWFNYANRLNKGVAPTDYYFGTYGGSESQTLANVHAKTFTGDLSGTAEKAVYDTNGASITSTYLSKDDASSTYLSKDDASSTYVQKSSIDSVPTKNSTNPVSSGGVYSALNPSAKIIEASKLTIYEARKAKSIEYSADDDNSYKCMYDYTPAGVVLYYISKSGQPHIINGSSLVYVFF